MDQERYPRETGKVREFIKRMNIKLSAHHFFGVDPIMEIDSRAPVTKEDVIQERDDGSSRFLDVDIISARIRKVPVRSCRRDGRTKRSWCYELAGGS